MALGMNDSGQTEILLEDLCTIQDSGKFQTRKPTDEETGADWYEIAKVRGPRAKMAIGDPVWAVSLSAKSVRRTSKSVIGQLRSVSW